MVYYSCKPILTHNRKEFLYEKDVYSPILAGNGSNNDFQFQRICIG